MKKVILSLSLAMMFLFAGTIAFADSSTVKKADTAITKTVDSAKAAVASEPATVAPAPAPDAGKGWLDYFMTPVGVIMLIVVITGYLTKNVPSASFLGITITQYISYAIAIAVCSFGYWQGLGVFADIGFKEVILDAIGFGLAANGVSTLPVTGTVLTAVKAKNAATTI